MKPLNNFGTYAIKKSTLTSSEVVKTVKADYKAVKQETKQLENEYFRNTIGIDYLNSVKRAMLNVKYFCIKVNENKQHMQYNLFGKEY